MIVGLTTLVASQVASVADEATTKRHASMIGLVRTINTLELRELNQYGSYEPWVILLAHHREEFSAWLKRFYFSDGTNVQFSDALEILPDWNLRLNIQKDGKGYVLLLDDAGDKTGFAAVSDERAVIRTGEYLR